MGLGLFPPGFLDLLSDLRFTGEVWAVPEGEVVFAGEPLVRVTGPLVEAQLAETFLLNQIARSHAAGVEGGPGGPGLRRPQLRRLLGPPRPRHRRRHGHCPGRLDRRRRGTSLVAAGQRWGIPLSGTMAHCS